MPSITERTVKRFFNGKGYHTKLQAYIAVARWEFHESCVVEGFHSPTMDYDALKAKYAEKFPVLDDAGCSCRGPLHNCLCIDDYGEPRKDFCNEKRRAYFRKRALELMEIDRLQPELAEVSA